MNEPCRRYAVIGAELVERRGVKDARIANLIILCPLRDGSFFGQIPGNKLPGYDHLVPTGRHHDQQPQSPPSTRLTLAHLLTSHRSAAQRSLFH